MESHVHKEERLTIYLEGDERFRFQTRTGPIQVSRIRFGSGTLAGRVSVRGWGIKKDGSQAAVQRDGDMPLSDLPREVLEAAIKALRGEQE